MSKHMLLLCWLACAGWLSTVRSDDIKKQEVEDASAVFGELLYNNYNTIKLLNEKIDRLASREEQTQQEISSLHSSIMTQLNALQKQESQSNSISASLTPAQQQCLYYTQQAEGHSCTRAPYLVLLGFSEFDAFGGSGVIISDRYVLARAELAKYTLYRDANRVAAVGVQERASKTGWQIYQVSEITVHPNYISRKPHNDIALLKTAQPIQFNEKVQPACLPFSEPQDQSIVVTSWDKLYDRVPFPTMPMKLSDVECLEREDKFNATTQMCLMNAGDKDDFCDIIWEDSAVVHNQNSCIVTIVGVETYRTTCLRPRCYIKVSAYLPWIQSVVWPQG